MRPIANAKRNEIIRLLRRGDKYSDIAKAVRTSTNTITKIAREIELPRRKRVAVNDKRYHVNGEELKTAVDKCLVLSGSSSEFPYN